MLSISPGFTSSEIHEFVLEYHLQPHGQKGAWRASQGVSIRQLRRWEAAVFAGDLDRGLIPRESEVVGVPRVKRTALSMAQSAKQDRDAAELARLQARVDELEKVNEALGKAIGLLHATSAHEPDAAPPMSDPEDSSPSKTASSPS